jgi:hypothetical protein
MYKLQVALMVAVASAVAALDASREDVDAVADGLGFLLSLAGAPENQVMPLLLLGLTLAVSRRSTNERVS